MDQEDWELRREKWRGEGDRDDESWSDKEIDM